jgi:biotin carboxylase
VEDHDQPVVMFVNTRSTLLESAPAFDAARRLGLEVVILADRPINVPHGLKTEMIEVDTYDPQTLTVMAERVASRRSVKGVVGWREQDVEGVAVVGEALGLPGHAVKVVQAVQDKAKARELLQEGVPDLTVAHRYIEEGQAIKEVLDGVPLPAIVKPVGSSGSRGIHRAGSREDLLSAIERVRQLTQPEVDRIFRRHAGGVILEEYISGSEHSVEAVLEDGLILVAMVTDKWVEPKYCLEYLQIHPSSLDSQEQQRLISSTQRIVTALGLGTGAVHVEYRFHQDGTPRVIEVNARAGGGCITSHLVRLAWDFDFIEAVLAVSCGLTVPACPARPRAVAGSMDILAEAEGTFGGIAGLDAALANTGVQHVSVDMPLGSKIVPPPASYTQHELATVVCAGYSNEAVEADLRAAAELIEPIIKP